MEIIQDMVRSLYIYILLAVDKSVRLNMLEAAWRRKGPLARKSRPVYIQLNRKTNVLQGRVFL